MLLKPTSGTGRLHDTFHLKSFACHYELLQERGYRESQTSLFLRESLRSVPIIGNRVELR